MPDGDRFEKTLHGKWWRKAYRQACAGDSFQMLGDTLMKAAADALRRQLACAALAKIRDAVYQALKEKARAGGDERQVRHSVLQLYRRYAAEWERFSARERLGVRARAA